MSELHELVPAQLLQDIISRTLKSSAVASITGVDISSVIKSVENLSLPTPEFLNHNYGDASDKVVTSPDFVKVTREATHNYYIGKFDDITYRTNPAVISGFLRQVALAAPAGLDRYAFTGKTSGEATNWTGFTGKSVELTDAESVRSAVYQLRANGWTGLGLVFDYSVYELVAEIFSSLQGSGSTNISVLDGSILFGVPVFFRNLYTEATSGKKVVGAVIAGEAFRFAVSPLELTEQGPFALGDKYDNSYRVIADQVIAFGGIQDGAITFKVTSGS